MKHCEKCTMNFDEEKPRFAQKSKALICPECRLTFYEVTSGNMVRVWTEPDNNLEPGEWSAKTKVHQVNQTSEVCQ